MAKPDTDVLRRQIRQDLDSLKALQGDAARRNALTRSERIFWTGLLTDLAKEALGSTLAGRMAARLVERIAERDEARPRR